MFQIRELRRVELPLFLDLQVTSLSSGIFSLIWPTPLSPDLASRLLDGHSKSFDSPRSRYLAVDDDAGRIIAVAKYIIYPTQRSDEDVEETLRMPAWVDEGSPLRELYQYLFTSRRTIMGRQAHTFVNILCTHPDHHRRGAGKALLDWGLREADAANLEMYLEATDMGRPLYERAGFVPVTEVLFDLSQWGREGTDRNTPMVRPRARPQPT